MPATKNDGDEQYSTESAALIASVTELFPEWSAPESGAEGLNLLAQADISLFRDVVHAYHTASDAERSGWRLVFLNQYGYEGESLVEEYRRMMELVPLMTRLEPDAPPGYRVAIIKKFQKQAEAFANAKPGSRNYRLVMAAIIAMHVKKKPPRYLNAEIGFIAEHLDELLPYLPYVKERGDVSISFLTELLNTPSTSLSKGVL
jgi:hypothetical protein